MSAICRSSGGLDGDGTTTRRCDRPGASGRSTRPSVSMMNPNRARTLGVISTRCAGGRTVAGSIHRPRAPISPVRRRAAPSGWPTKRCMPLGDTSQTVVSEPARSSKRPSIEFGKCISSINHSGPDRVSAGPAESSLCIVQQAVMHSGHVPGLGLDQRGRGGMRGRGRREHHCKLGKSRFAILINLGKPRHERGQRRAGDVGRMHAQRAKPLPQRKGRHAARRDRPVGEPWPGWQRKSCIDMRPWPGSRRPGGGPADGQRTPTPGLQRLPHGRRAPAFPAGRRHPAAVGTRHRAGQHAMDLRVSAGGDGGPQRRCVQRLLGAQRAPCPLGPQPRQIGHAPRRDQPFRRGAIA